MRIIHTSDWHLGQYFYGKSRANEHQLFLSWLLEQVPKYEVGAIIVAGDIFDTSTPPSYAREMYFDFIAKLHKISCQLIILAGNHDSVAMLAESQSVLSNLSTRVITHVVPISEDRDDKIAHSENGYDLETLNQQVFALGNGQGKTQAVICAVPFVRPRDVIKSKAGQSASEKQQSLQQAIAAHYQMLYQHAQLLARNIEQEQGQAIPIIATGHLTALGVSLNDSKSDSVRDIYIGSLEAFPAAAFPPFDYIALGHIHRAQRVAKSEHIRYCGSPIALSFDEAKQEKKVLVAEFSGHCLEQVTDLVIPCFQPLYMVKTSVDDLEINLESTLAEFEIYQQERKKISSPLTSCKAWLDIEIDHGDHLTDLSQRVSELVSDLPVEVLLVRRSKKSRKRQQNQLSHQDNSTLSELSLQEVFDSRLSQLDWQSDDELARKARLQCLFTELSQEKDELISVKETHIDIEKTPEKLSENSENKANDNTIMNKVDDVTIEQQNS
jgi:exonuclease SbcD